MVQEPIGEGPASRRGNICLSFSAYRVFTTYMSKVPCPSYSIPNLSHKSLSYLLGFMSRRIIRQLYNSRCHKVSLDIRSSYRHLQPLHNRRGHSTFTGRHAPLPETGQYAQHPRQNRFGEDLGRVAHIKTCITDEKGGHRRVSSPRGSSGGSFDMEIVSGPVTPDKRWFRYEA